jgi:dienelactone hydrolase
VKYLVDQGIADPKHVGIMGGSYGGYATLAGVTFTPSLAAAVDYVGPSNLLTARLDSALLGSVSPGFLQWAIRRLLKVAEASANRR